MADDVGSDVPPQLTADPERRTLMILLLIVAVGFGLRAAFVWQPPAGFLAWNEGFYLELGIRDAARGAFAWFTDPLQAGGSSPLFPLLVSLLARIGAPLVIGARLISILSGVASIVLTFVLGKSLYDERTGLLGSAIVAVTPGMVLVDHNIQVDALFTALLLGSLVLYVEADRLASPMRAAIGGIVFGLALATKPTAAILVPALFVFETWRGHGLRWLRERRVRLFAGWAAIFGAPWYVYQLVQNRGAYLSATSGIAANEGASGAAFWTIQFAGEFAWMLLPTTAVLALAAIAYLAGKRGPADKLLLTVIAAVLIWYMRFHFHSYYLALAAPFIALAIARLLYAVRLGPRVRTVAIAVLVASMALGAVLLMSGQKWGRFSPMLSADAFGNGSGTVRLYVVDDVQGVFGSTPALSDPSLNVTFVPLATAIQQVRADAPGERRLMLCEPLQGPDGTPLASAMVATDHPWRLVLFGVAIGQWPPTLSDAQLFRNAPWTFERVGPPWRFGSVEGETPSGFVLYDAASFR